MPLGGSVAGYRVVPSYTGPGDVVSGAYQWGGLRAYSGASIGSNAVRLRESGGNTEQDFKTIASGSLDLAAITTFKGANQIFVVKLYDQTGNGRDFSQAVAANQPEFVLNTIGSLPAMKFVSASASGFSRTQSGNLSQPYTLVCVTERTGSATYQSIFNCNLIEADFGNVANKLEFYSNTPFVSITSVTDNAFHGIIFLGNGASSLIHADGTDGTAGNAGSTAPQNADQWLIGQYAGTIQKFDGFICEAGFWTSGFSTTDRTSMTTNQKNYWGY